MLYHIHHDYSVTLPAGQVAMLTSGNKHVKYHSPLTPTGEEVVQVENIFSDTTGKLIAKPEVICLKRSIEELEQLGIATKL